MQHHIPPELGPQRDAMANAVSACVHCGFCLPTCPTYELLGEEMDSPRGRIVLMKEVLEGTLDPEEAAPYIDPCLGCLACVSACPSGVQYGELLTPFRMLLEQKRQRPWAERALRGLLLATLPYPGRFRAAALLGRVARPLAGPLRALPGRLGAELGPRLAAMLELLPRRLPPAELLPEYLPAHGTRRARVALLASCAQRVLEPDIDAATLRVLAYNGVEVVVPREQGCCGALAAHTGAGEQARAFARRNLRAFPTDVDAVLSNAAGCGSGLHEYPLWLAGEPEEEAARAFSRRVRDVSVFLAELGIEPPPPLPRPLRVAYHDACHLAHAQGVRREPRELLTAIAGLELLEPADAEICCGSAGSYNVEQPELARELGERKAKALLATGAELVVSGNIGCMTQLRSHLERLGEPRGRPLPVLHTVQLLDRAYRGEVGLPAR